MDQRTVARWFGRPPPTGTAPAQAADGAQPYLVLQLDRPLVRNADSWDSEDSRFAIMQTGAPPFDLRSALAAPAQSALARRPDGSFDVVGLVPTGVSTPVQDAAAQQAQADARSVAEALAFNGVPPDQLHISLRDDPGQPGRQVRVYVR